MNRWAFTPRPERRDISSRDSRGTNTKADDFDGRLANKQQTMIEASGVTQGGSSPMIRILVALAFVVGLTNFSFAQSYCQQIRQAIATYGHTAAKRHALAHYGPKAIQAGNRCLRKGKRR